MNKVTATVIATMMCCGIFAAESKIAIIDSDEIIDMIKIKVLARPENSETKKMLAAVEKKLKLAHDNMSESLKDEERKKEVLAEMMAVNNEKEAVEKIFESQVQSEYLKVIKELTKGKYSVVLNAGYVKEAIVTKDAELVDITIDVKESLLVK